MAKGATDDNWSLGPRLLGTLLLLLRLVLGGAGRALQGGGEVGGLAANHEGGNHLVVPADVLEPQALVVRHRCGHHRNRDGDQPIEIQYKKRRRRRGKQSSSLAGER